jgi:hypothetical protein
MIESPAFEEKPVSKDMLTAICQGQYVIGMPEGAMQAISGQALETSRTTSTVTYRAYAWQPRLDQSTMSIKNITIQDGKISEISEAEPR